MTASAAARCSVLAAACVVALAGCAGSQDEPAASAAQQLLGAAHAGDGEAACAVLAPAVRGELEQQSGQPCERAVLDEDLGDGTTDVDAVDVFDSMAKVVAGGQTLFLSRFDGGWKVVGAACTPVAGEPYDCSIGLP
jgi:hypothetical protein